VLWSQDCPSKAVSDRGLITGRYAGNLGPYVGSNENEVGVGTFVTRPRKLKDSGQTRPVGTYIKESVLLILVP